jgi:hypothetical protein
MKGIPTDLDEMEIEEENEPTELCPICGENMMRPGDKMCEECRKKAEYEEEEPDPEQDDDEEWRNYLDDDADAGLEEDIGEIDETFDEDFDDEEEEETDEGSNQNDDDDMDYVTGDEIYSLTDDDDDDEDDDDKKDEDDF